MQIISGLARNRTWIWSFGNSYTIHCTTGPGFFQNGKDIKSNPEKGNCKNIILLF